MSEITRRGFLSGMGTAAAVMGTSSVALASQPKSSRSSAAKDFDETYDVVVIGDGFAGNTAALFAAKAGAKVLILEKADEGARGGNSRVCGQMMLYAHDYDACVKYLTALQGEMNHDDEYISAYADGITNLKDILSEFGIDNPVEWHALIEDNEETAKKTGIKMLAGIMAPEYPEFPGSDQMDAMCAHEGVFDSYFYQTVAQTVDSLENVTVAFQTPAKHLIQDPETKAIVGVIAERDGAEVRYGATSGVVMACGGFECNKDMIENFIGCSYIGHVGGDYNTGDGIKMAQEVGADFWHLTSYEGGGLVGGLSWRVPEGDRAPFILGFGSVKKGAIFIVADDGTRYFNEVQTSRHGKINFHGIYRAPNTSIHPWMIFDQSQYDAFDQKGGILPDDASIIVTGETIEEIAEKTGIDPEKLADTYVRFNEYAQTGEDRDYGRAAESMAPFEGTIYAIPLIHVMLNTQGGARRNAKAQVLDPDGNPIPNLYSAGEFGGVASFYYNGGGNVAECLTFGKIAGTNAAGVDK